MSFKHIMIVSLITEKKNIQPIFQQKFHSRTFTSTLQKDVFVKNSKQEFLSLPSEEIIKKIEESLKNIKNKLGTGAEANVWRIKNSSYCVRIPIGVYLDEKDSINKNLTK